MAYSTIILVRSLTSLTTSDISDADLTLVIALADTRVDTEPAVSLSSDQQELASTYLSASIAMQRLAVTGANKSDFSLGAFRVNKTSAVNLRNALANQFYEIYKTIISYGTDGTGIRKIESE